MTPKDLFGVIVRTVGLLVALYGIWGFLYGLWDYLAALTQAEQSEESYLLMGLVFMAVGAALMIGAPVVERIAYTAKTKSN